MQRSRRRSPGETCVARISTACCCLAGIARGACANIWRAKYGVLLAARSHAADGRHSVLFGRRTTALTWALERKGWTAGRIFRFWDSNYYRTYDDGPGKPTGYMSVQQEVTRALARPEDFLDVPADAPDHRRKTGGMVRDTWDDDRAAFVVRDGDYVSARWPGDAHTFARRFAEVLAERCSR
jgi:hypothetical protein